MRQPNWKLKVIEAFSDGSPKLVLFFEPNQLNEEDLPIKLLTYHPEGYLLEVRRLFLLLR